MSKSAISLKNLHKNYKVHVRPKGTLAAFKSLYSREFKIVEAVKDVSFDIEQGEAVAFLGPNGAGKTTTIKLMSGLLYPDQGEMEVLGHMPFNRDERFLKDITLMMGRRDQLVWDVPAIESFEFFKTIYEIPDQTYKTMLNNLVDVFNLGEVINLPVRNLSLGQRMKLELAGSLLHQPKLLFLDEPTIGLDIIAREDFRSFIRYYHETTDATIILTSHYMGDIEALCERVIVIDSGSIVFDGNMKDLVHKFSKFQVIKCQLSDSDQDLSRFGEVLRVENNEITLQVDQNETPKIISEIMSAHNVINLAVTSPPMEDVIKHIYRNDNNLVEHDGALKNVG